MSTSLDQVAEGRLSDKLQEVITYNGIDKNFEAEPEETVRSLLNQAIRAFGITQNAHLLALFTSDGRELLDTKSLIEEGVKSHDHLLLRPSAVRGGG